MSVSLFVFAATLQATADAPSLPEAAPVSVPVLLAAHPATKSQPPAPAVDAEAPLPPPGGFTVRLIAPASGSLFADDDYPAQAIRNEEEGSVGFRLYIGEDGLVGRCAVTSSSGSAVLDSRTCLIAQRRARFEPARDANGNPVPAYVDAGITWRLAGRAAPAAAAGSITKPATPE